MKEYEKPIEPTSEETERLMDQEFGYDPDKRMSVVATAEAYARRQWSDSAPQDYVDGSKEDYLRGYADAVDDVYNWIINTYLGDYVADEFGTGCEGNNLKLANDMRKALMEK